MICVHCATPLQDGSVPCPACGNLQPPIDAAREGDEPTLMRVRALDVLEGKWRLERKLGEGGMGIVYLAHDLQLDRKVAVKLLSARLAGDAELVMRFEREARLTAGLEHPNIVPVYAVGRYHGRPFMVMKALEGRTLSTLLDEKGALPPAEMFHLARQIVAGLDFIHARGFIHRDIKAGNIFVGPDGHATVLDFGILRSSRGADALTRTGMVMGTPQYMSPEQAKGVRELDHRSDLYALAVLLFECASGSLPFEGDSDLAVVQMQAHAPAPDIRERAPWISAEVAEVFARALSKAPEDRYPTAGDLLRALDFAYAGQAPLLLSTHTSVVGGPLRGTPSHPSFPASPTAQPPPAASPPPGATPSAAFPAPVVPGPSTAELALRLKSGRGRWVVALAVSLALLGAGMRYLRRRSGKGSPSQAQPAAQVQAQTPAPVQAQPAAQVQAQPAAQVQAQPPAAQSQPPAQAPAQSSTPQNPVMTVASTSRKPPPVDNPGSETVTPGGKPRPRGNRSSVELAVHKPAASGPGYLHIITTRGGESYWAEVLVDGQRKGATPLQLEVAPGSHHIRIERTGFKPIERQITVAAGSHSVLRMPLVP